MAASSTEIGKGTILAGRYELLGVLGKGGMGVVYRGKHLGTDRPIAVKVLRRELAADPTIAKRFVREAKAAAALRHPNVVDVLDYGVDVDGTAYQVLELLEGESLREYLERKEDAPLDVTVGLLLPVMHALAMAHARGVVHRNLKPDNVFLARNAHGRVVPTLLDFGIAKVMPKEGAQATLSTRVGAVMGTPAYMSPEQARGRPDVDKATDIWAIGVILFECLSGQTPFEADTPSMMMARIMMEQAQSLAVKAPKVPESIVAVVDRALAQKAEARWGAMDEFAEALRAAAASAGVAVPAAGASDAAPMSLPPPRKEIEETTPGHAGSSDDDLDIEVDHATRAQRSRKPRIETHAPTAGKGEELGHADTAHARRASERPEPRASVTGERAVPAAEPASAPAPAPARSLAVPLLGLVAVLLVIAIAVAWSGRGGAPPSTIAAPSPSTTIDVHPPPTIAPPTSVTVSAPPSSVTVTPPPTTRTGARGHRDHATDLAATPPPTSSAATHDRHDPPHTGLPGVAEWE